jgi:hypothetical protein
MTIRPEETRLQGWEATLFQAAHAISLPEGLYTTITDRYNTLQGILQAADDPILQRAHVFAQGSIRLRTAIKPARGAEGELATVDADAVIWLEDADDAQSEHVLKAIEKRFTEGSRVETPIQKLRRGIRIVYANEAPGFHIDVTPARNVTANTQSGGHGALQVPDREQGWKASSPIAYSDWLHRVGSLSLRVITMEALNFREGVIAKTSQEDMPAYGEYIDANVLRAAIKLLKRHRDLWALRNPELRDYRPISAVLTTLAGRAYEQIAEGASVRMERRPLDALLELIGLMPTFIKGGPGSWRVLNPVDEGENFAEKWNRPETGQRYREAFAQWHRAAQASFRLGLEEMSSLESFKEAVSASFGTSRTLIEQVIKDFPATWNLPGVALGTTRSSLVLGALSGSAVAGSSSQSHISPPGRLG